MVNVKMSQCAASKLHSSQKNLITNHHRQTKGCKMVASTLTAKLKSAPFGDQDVGLKSEKQG